MIAASAGYDVIFVIHISVAIATFTVYVTLRNAALSVARGADSSIQVLRFPERRDWAARLLHLLPVTGLIMSLSGGPSVSLARPWVGVGLVCYLAAAGHLEARTLPQERAIATTIARDDVAARDQGRQLVRSVDTLLALVAIALLSMVIQF
jgi:hypothetical protein